MAMSSPWAILITPIRPNTIARPSAINMRMVNMDRPVKACMANMSTFMIRSSVIAGP